KSAIDALPTSASDVVYWDAGYPGFGVKVTPKGRKVFIVLYRTGGARPRPRQLPHRPERGRCPHPTPVGGPESVRGEARRPRSGRREASGEATYRGRRLRWRSYRRRLQRRRLVRSRPAPSVLRTSR